MTIKKILAAGAAAIAVAAASGGVALAQTTTADMRGVITDEAGAPLSGVTVVITDTRTGATRTVTTDGQGRFNAQNLNASGNYTVTATRSGFQGEAVEGVRLSISDTTVITLDLASAGATGDEIVVLGTRSASIDIATGPAATFNFDDLQNTPAISRDIKDIIKTDPRIFIDESFGNGLQCAGASPRFNSVTVDGIRLNDNFGLNANGYPTERLPFPFDAINQVAVELAPFDVEYGGFTGCNINMVTRSGSNEFHGSGWFDWTSDKFNGKKLEGSTVDIGNFSDFRFGATLSGPIIKDKLFFFAAYEKINETQVIGRGPAEAGSFGVQGVSQAQLDLIADIARNVYGYEPGDLPDASGEDDEKILARLDWVINDNHRAAFTYNYNNGFNVTPSDSGPTEYEFFNHYYNRGTKLKSYSGQIFSNWTDNFSTEARVSYTTNDTFQRSVGGTDFGEIQIRTFNNGQSATVYLGADDSRHSNALKTDTLNMKFKGDYTLNNHIFSFGYERETVDVFNLFIQHTEGEYRFDRVTSFAGDPNVNITAFLNGQADDIFYGNAAGTNDPADGAAEFKFTTNSIYGQDEFTVDEIGLTVTAGWRYDWYTSGDVPRLNSNFLARNGFDNTSTFDGRGLIQPRFGFNWEATDSLTIRGGGGLFSGGNPNVWLSNSYQNDSVSVIQLFDGGDFVTGLVDTTVPGFWTNDEGGQNRPFYSVPTAMFDAVANGSASNGSVNAVDPNFDIPSQWKAALGATYDFGDGYRLMLDFLYTRDQDAAAIIDATLEQIATAPDGRPIYRAIDRSDPLCATSPTTCTERRNTQDFILTNNDGGSQKVFSAALSKQYDWSNGWEANWTLAYAYTDAKDRNPMTSSVAFSNFVNFSTADPNNPSLANSNYEVPHRFTLRAGINMPLISEEFRTRVSLFGVVTQSRPYSFVFGASGDVFGDGLDFRHLLYVPTDASDPNVIFAPAFDTAAFFSTVSALGLDKYRGQIVPRNDFQSDWYSQWDLRFEQEIPSVFDGHVAKLFVIVDNVGNLLNDKWGVINQAGFPGSVALVNLNEAAGCAQCAAGSPLGPNGEYIFSSFNAVTPDSIQAPLVNPSLWSVRFGVKYEF